MGYDGFNFMIHPPQKLQALAMADIGGYWEERQRKLETQQVDTQLFGSVANCLGTEADRWWMVIGLSYRLSFFYSGIFVDADCQYWAC